jgi:hypothetical protein
VDLVSFAHLCLDNDFASDWYFGPFMFAAWGWQMPPLLYTPFAVWLGNGLQLFAIYDFAALHSH